MAYIHTRESLNTIDLEVNRRNFKELYSGIRRKRFRGVQGYGRPRRGSGGADRPGRRRNFLKFAKNSLRKLLNMHYFSLFFKKFQNYALHFCAFGRKTQFVGKFEKILKIFDENSIEKLHFYLFLGKLLLKIEPSEITSVFYNNFFRFGAWV